MSNPFEKYFQATERQQSKLDKVLSTPSASLFQGYEPPNYNTPSEKSAGDHLGDTATDAAKALLTAQGVAVSAVDLGLYSLGGLGSLAQTIGHTVAPDTIPEVVVPEYGVGSKALNDTFGVNIADAKQYWGNQFYSDARKKQEAELQAGYTESQMSDWKKSWEDSYATQLTGLQRSGATEQQLKDFNDGFNKQYQEAAKQFIASKQTSWDKSFSENASIVGDAFGYVADNPSLGVGAAIDSLGYLLPSLAVSKGVLALQNAAKAASVGGKAIAAGVGEGSVSSLAIAEQMRNNSDTGTIGGGKLLAAAAAGTLTGLIGGASNKLGARLGLEDIDTAGLAALGTGAATRLPALTRPIAAIGQEGGEEFLQGFGETIIPNIAEGKDPLQGLNQELALGTFAGGIMGAGTNAKGLVSGAASDIKAGFNVVSDAANLKSFDTLSNPEHKNYNPAQAFNTQLKNLESNDETVRTQAEASVSKIETDLNTARASVEKRIKSIQATLKAMPPSDQTTDAQKLEIEALGKEYSELTTKSSTLADQYVAFLDAQVTAQEHRDVQQGTQFTEEQAKADIATLTQPIPSQTVWSNQDTDIPVEVIGEPEVDEQGNEFTKVRYTPQEGADPIESYVPTSELVSTQGNNDVAQQEALDRVTRHFSKYSNDDLDLLATSPVFNEAQRNSLRLMSKSKRELAAVQDPSQVFDNILNGYKGKTIQESHRGLNQYTDMVNTAVATKNEQLASLALDGLGAFTDDHTAKRDAINEAFGLVQKGTYKEIRVVRTEDGTWGFVPFTAQEVRAGKNADGVVFLEGKALKAAMNKVGGFNVHINSNTKGAITQINNETQLIQDRFDALSGVAESFVGVTPKPVETSTAPTIDTPVVTESSQRSPKLEEAYKETFSKPIENWDANDFASVGAQATHLGSTFDSKTIDADNAFSQKMAKKIIADGIAKNRSTADIMQDVMFVAYSPDFAMSQSGVSALNAYIELRKAQGTSTTPIVTEPSDTTAPVDNPVPEAPVQSDVPTNAESEASINVWAGSNENAGLSNLATRPFTFGTKKYQSVEHAYQTLKSGSFDQQTYDKYAGTENKKIAGNRGTKTTDNANVRLMEKLMTASFEQNKDAMQLLQKTGDAVITHTQDKSIWGKEFPRILMEIRKSSKAAPTVQPVAPVTPTEPIETVADSEQQLSSLTKTASDTVKLPSDYGQSDIFKAVPLFKKENPTGIIAFRVNSKRTLLESLKDANAIGNPFNWQNPKIGAGNATKMFDEWLRTGKHTDHAEAPQATEEYRQAILSKLKENPTAKILYYKELNGASHANVLEHIAKGMQQTATPTETKTPVQAEVTTTPSQDTPDVTEGVNQVAGTKQLAEVLTTQQSKASDVLTELKDSDSSRLPKEYKAYLDTLLEQVVKVFPDTLVQFVKDISEIPKKYGIEEFFFGKQGTFNDEKFVFIRQVEKTASSDRHEVTVHEFIHVATADYIENKFSGTQSKTVRSLLDAARAYVRTFKGKTTDGVKVLTHVLNKEGTYVQSRELLAYGLTHPALVAELQKIPYIWTSANGGIGTIASSMLEVVEPTNVYEALLVAYGNILEIEESKLESTKDNTTTEATQGLAVRTGNTSESTTESEPDVQGTDGGTGTGNVEVEQTSTESQVEPAVPKDAKVTVLQGVTDEVAAEERKKPFNLRNILKGYFTQSTTKEDATGANPLVTVKDFISNFDVPTQVRKWLNDRRKPTEKQLEQLEHFKKFHAEFAKALKFVFNTQASAIFVSNKENLVGYLEMGKKPSTRELDENVVTALALSAYSYLIKQGNKVMNTNEELETLFRFKKGMRAPLHIEQMFRFAGQEMPIVVKALGTDTAKALGLKVREDQDPTLQDRLNTALGILAMEAMAKAGFVVIDTLEGKPLTDFLTAIKTVRESKAHTSEDEYDFEVDTDVETKISKFTMVRPNAKMEGKGNSVFEKGIIETEVDGKIVRTETITLNRPVLTEGLPTLNSPLVNELIEANKDTKGFLSYLFGVDVGLTTPLKEIPKKFTQKLINGTDASVPSVQAELLTEAQKHSFTMRTNTVAVFAAMQKLGENSQFLKELLGIWIDDHVLSRTHVTERDSLQAKAQNDWTAVLNGLEWADATLDENGQYTQFYDTQFVAQNQRQHLNANMFSAQSSQIHRAMAALTGFSTTIDLSQDEQGTVKDEALLNLFYQAVGEGLEGLDDYLKADILSKAEAGLHQFFTVDKVYGDYYVPALKAFLQTEDSQNAIKAMRVLIETGTIDATQQKAIAWFVEKGEMGAQSLQSLIALAELDIAQANGTTFTTTIGFGSDGVNHGVSAANMLTGVISKDMRKQTGIFPIAEKGEDQIDNMQEVYRRGVTDYYVDFGKVMAAKLRDLIPTFVGKLNTDFVEGMQALFPKFEALDETGVLKNLLAMRKMAKIWAIPFNYSAGKAALQRALARGFLAGIYGEMNKLANEALDIIDAKKKEGLTAEQLAALDVKLETVKLKTKTLEENLNKVLGKYGTSVTLPEEPQLLNEEDKGKLSNELENTLMQAAIDLHGEAAWKATEEFAKDYLQVRNVYTEVEKASFTLFDVVRNQLIEEKKASRKYTNVDAKVQVKGKTVQYTAEELNAQEAEYFGLTTVEIAEVDAALAAMRPMFNTALSIGSESTNAADSVTNPSGVSVRKHKMQREPAKGLRAVNTFYLKEIDANRKPFSEARNIGLTKEVEENAGVASSANAIQSIDAFVAAKVQAFMDALNVHDAAIFGLKNFLKGVKKQNEEHLRALTNYQLGLEHAKMLVKVYVGYKAFMATQEEALKSEDVMVKENAQKLITKAKKQMEVLLQGEQMFKGDTALKINNQLVYKGGLIPKLQAAGLDIKSTASIEEAIGMFIDFAINQDAKKLGILKDTFGIHQFAGEGGMHQLTDENRASITEQEALVEKAKEDLQAELKGKSVEQVAEVKTPKDTKPVSVFISFLRSFKDGIVPMAELLDHLKNRSDIQDAGARAAQGEVLKAITPLLDANTKVVYSIEDYDGYGYFDEETNTLHINAAREDGVKTSLAVHELLHAVLSRRIKTLRNDIENKTGNNSEAVTALQRLDTLRERLLLSITDPVLRDMLKNTDEFISYGLTDSRLQRAMKNVDVAREGRTVSIMFRKFVEFVGQILGFRSKEISALAAFASDTAALLETIGSVTPVVASNNGERLFSKNTLSGNGLTVASTRQILVKQFGEKLIKALEAKGLLRIVETMAETPEAALESNTEGYYLNGKATLVVDGLTPETVVATLLHELSGHKGFQELMEPAAYNALMKQFDKLVAEGNPIALAALKRAQEATGSDGKPLSLQGQMDEYLPYLLTIQATINATQAQKSAITKFLDNVFSAVRAWAYKKLQANGYEGAASAFMQPQDIVYMAERMLREMANNPVTSSNTQSPIKFSTKSAEDLVNGQSSLDIMQALPHSNTGSFNQQLDRLITEEIGQLYNQDDAAKARIDEIQTLTASDALNAGFSLSRKEQYVQQALQYAVAAYMKLHAGGANVGQLNRVYHAAKAKMDATGKDFHEGDWATATQQERDIAKAKYDFMFDSTKEGYMSRFVSMALASESVSKILDIALPLTKPETQDKTWFETVNDWVSYVMAWLTNKYVRLNPTLGASNQLVQLMDNLVKLDIRNRQEGVALHQKAWNTIGLVTTPLNKALKGAGGALLSGVGLRESRFLPVRALGAILVLRSEEAAKAIPKMIIDMRNNQLPNTKLGEVANILLEASGVGTLRDKFDVLIRQTNLNAKNRQDIVDNVKKAVNTWFKAPLTKAQHAAVAYGLLGTDAQALLENYSVEDIVNMALHEGKLNAEIAKLKKEIAKNPNGNDMLNAAEQLGYYMVTRIGGEGLVKNALGIAIGLGTQYFTSVEQADPKLVGQLNTLVSMLAMTHVPNSDKAILAALYKTDAEGIHATIQLHNGLVNDSLKDFQANPLNMVKGWMPEVTNPYLEIKAANSMVERQQMEAEGWVLIDELKRDKHDKGSPKYLMKHNDIGYQRLVSGAVDLGSTARSGTEAINRTSPKYLGITQARYQNAARRAAIPNGSFDPSKQPRGLIAAYDTDGVALGFNYEMDNETRDAHLDRKHNIGDLLGTFGGLNYYKPEKAKQSNKVAEVLFEDYKANYSQNPNAYLKISHKSTDPKVVEMWRMLPQDFKQRATELYGKGNPIIIRNEAFNLAFGFKKFSVVSYAFDAVKAERERIKNGLVGTGKSPNAFQSGFVRLAEATRGNTAQADFAKAEHVTQEIVKAIKDFIVIRSGTTMMWNIFANVLMLMANGINPVTIIKDWVFAVTNVRAYQKLNSQLIQAQADLAGGKDPIALKQRIGALKAELKANVMNPYINAGLLSSIVEDVNIQQGEYTYTSAFKQTVDEKTQWIPKPVKTAAAVLTIAPSTKLYQFLATTTQLSDFVAKYSMSKHLQANGTDINASIIEASKTFINYDVPTSQGLQYANDMGLFMFTKFFLRIQAVLMKLLGKRAGSAIAQHLLVENLTGAEGVLSPMAFGHIGNNPLESSVLGLPSAFFSIGTVDAVTDFGAPF